MFKFGAVGRMYSDFGSKINICLKILSLVLINCILSVVTLLYK